MPHMAAVIHTWLLRQHQTLVARPSNRGSFTRKEALAIPLAPAAAAAWPMYTDIGQVQIARLVIPCTSCQKT
jgi:hypothetical protein